MLLAGAAGRLRDTRLEVVFWLIRMRAKLLWSASSMLVRVCSRFTMLSFVRLTRGHRVADGEI
jgi:hypothetical protein